MADRERPDAEPRRYDDAEIRLLLERASRVQQRRVPAPKRQQGLTLAQLEDVAAQAQIDIGRLREAARELDVERASRPQGAAARLAGTPLRLQVEHVLPFEADEDALGALAGSLGSIADETGEIRIVGRSLIWTASTTSGRRAEVNVTVHRGETRIRIEERYGELAGGLFGGVLGGVGGGAGIGGGVAVASALGSAALAVAIPVAVVAGSYAACRAGLRAYVRRRSRQIDAICERIVQELTARAE